jgi:hypothetical protein
MTKVRPLADPDAEDEIDATDIRALGARARRYLESFRWIGRVVEEYAGLTVAPKLGVFLFRIEPSGPEIDEWLWVVVGDLPPAYLVIDEAPNAASALDAYVYEMQQWVDAVQAAKPVDAVIPVNAEPTREHAHMLQRRLTFIRDRILNEYADDLKA